MNLEDLVREGKDLDKVKLAVASPRGGPAAPGTPALAGSVQVSVEAVDALRDLMGDIAKDSVRVDLAALELSEAGARRVGDAPVAVAVDLPADLMGSLVSTAPLAPAGGKVQWRFSERVQLTAAHRQGLRRALGGDERTGASGAETGVDIIFDVLTVLRPKGRSSGSSVRASRIKVGEASLDLRAILSSGKDVRGADLQVASVSETGALVSGETLGKLTVSLEALSALRHILATPGNNARDAAGAAGANVMEGGGPDSISIAIYSLHASRSLLGGARAVRAVLTVEHLGKVLAKSPELALRAETAAAVSAHVDARAETPLGNAVARAIQVPSRGGPDPALELTLLLRTPAGPGAAGAGAGMAVVAEATVNLSTYLTQRQRDMVAETVDLYPTRASDDKAGASGEERAPVAKARVDMVALSALRRLQAVDLTALPPPGQEGDRKLRISLASLDLEPAPRGAPAQRVWVEVDVPGAPAAEGLVRTTPLARAPSINLAYSRDLPLGDTAVGRAVTDALWSPGEDDSDLVFVLCEEASATEGRTGAAPPAGATSVVELGEVRCRPPRERPPPSPHRGRPEAPRANMVGLHLSRQPLVPFASPATVAVSCARGHSVAFLTRHSPHYDKRVPPMSPVHVLWTPGVRQSRGPAQAWARPCKRAPPPQASPHTACAGWQPWCGAPRSCGHAHCVRGGRIGTPRHYAPRRSRVRPHRRAPTCAVCRWCPARGSHACPSRG